MSGVSDKKLKTKTLQLRAGSEYTELIEIIVKEANIRAAMAGSSQIFNNSDILKEAIKGLTGNDIYIDIEGNRFAVKELTNNTFDKFEGQFQDIIDKEQLKSLLKIGTVRFINDSVSDLEQYIEDIILDKKKKSTVMINGHETDLKEVQFIIGGMDHYNIEDFIDYFDNVDEDFDKFISGIYGSNNISKSRVLDDKVIDMDKLERIEDKSLKDDLKLIAKYSSMYGSNYDMKADIREYIMECILDAEEFSGINAYKLKNDYNQRKILTRLRVIAECYIEDITR